VIYLAHEFKNKNIDEALFLFEADGVLILCDNQKITGHSSIAEALKPYMKVDYFKLTTEPIAFLSTKRDIAFTRTSWSAWIKVEDGTINDGERRKQHNSTAST